MKKSHLQTISFMKYTITGTVIQQVVNFWSMFDDLGDFWPILAFDRCRLNCVTISEFVQVAEHTKMYSPQHCVLYTQHVKIVLHGCCGQMPRIVVPLDTDSDDSGIDVSELEHRMAMERGGPGVDMIG